MAGRSPAVKDSVLRRWSALGVMGHRRAEPDALNGRRRVERGWRRRRPSGPEMGWARKGGTNYINSNDTVYDLHLSVLYETG